MVQTTCAVRREAPTCRLEVLDQLHSDPRYALTMDLRPGQLQFLNNHVILHGRTAYQDYADPERRRHLIRVWLDVDRPLAPVQTY